MELFIKKRSGNSGFVAAKACYTNTATIPTGPKRQTKPFTPAMGQQGWSTVVRRGHGMAPSAGKTSTSQVQNIHGRMAVRCFNCGGIGHIAKACPSQQGNRRYGVSGNMTTRYYNCGDKNHIFPKCSKPKKECGTCRKIGHTTVECYFN